MDAILATILVHLTSTNLEILACLALFALGAIIALRPVIGWYFKLDAILEELKAINNQLLTLTSAVRSLDRPRQEAPAPAPAAAPAPAPKPAPAPVPQPQEVPWEELIYQHVHSQSASARPLLVEAKPAEPAPVAKTSTPPDKIRPSVLPEL